MENFLKDLVKDMKNEMYLESVSSNDEIFSQDEKIMEMSSSLNNGIIPDSLTVSPSLISKQSLRRSSSFENSSSVTNSYIQFASQPTFQTANKFGVTQSQEVGHLMPDASNQFHPTMDVVESSDPDSPRFYRETWKPLDTQRDSNAKQPLSLNKPNGKHLFAEIPTLAEKNISNSNIVSTVGDRLPLANENSFHKHRNKLLTGAFRRPLGMHKPFKPVFKKPIKPTSKECHTNLDTVENTENDKPATTVDNHKIEIISEKISNLSQCEYNNGENSDNSIDLNINSGKKSKVVPIIETKKSNLIENGIEDNQNRKCCESATNTKEMINSSKKNVCKDNTKSNKPNFEHTSKDREKDCSSMITQSSKYDVIHTESRKSASNLNDSTLDYSPKRSAVTSINNPNKTLKSNEKFSKREKNNSKHKQNKKSPSRLGNNSKFIKKSNQKSILSSVNMIKKSPKSDSAKKLNSYEKNMDRKRKIIENQDCKTQKLPKRRLNPAIMGDTSDEEDSRDLNNKGASHCLSEEHVNILCARQRISFPIWVECDRCNKWRKLENNFDPVDFHGISWQCSENNDERYDSCDKPEESFENVEMAYLEYTLGSVVWARFDGEFWPAMVDDEPDEMRFFKGKMKSPLYPIQYHVTFFGGGEPVRSWVMRSDLRKFTSKNDFENQTIRCNKYWYDEAIRVAEHAIQQSLINRRKLNSFIHR